MSEVQIGYDRIMDSLLTNPIHPLLRPIHFVAKDRVTFAASGTLVLGPGGEHRAIITAAHLFVSGKDRQSLFYQILQPLSPELYPIKSVKEATDDDVAICQPGPTGFIQCCLREKVWAGQTGDLYRSQASECTLLTTGQKIPVLGHVIGETGEKYFILRYRAYPGESGSGALINNNEFYVLKGHTPLCDVWRSLFDLPPSESHATLASGVMFQ